MILKQFTLVVANVRTNCTKPSSLNAQLESSRLVTLDRCSSVERERTPSPFKETPMRLREVHRAAPDEETFNVSQSSFEHIGALIRRVCH
jgi:hypothetical protein